MATPIEGLFYGALTAGGSWVLVGAAIVVAGVRQRAGLALATHLLAGGALTALAGWRLWSAAGQVDPTPFSVEATIASTALLLLSGLGLAAFVAWFPGKATGAERRDLLVALGASAMAGGAVWASFAPGTSLEQSLFALVSLAVPVALTLFAILALPLRFHHRRDSPWSRAALAWFGMMALLTPAWSNGVGMMSLGALGFGSLLPGILVAAVTSASLLYLRPSLAGASEASLAGRNLCLLLFGVMTAGVLAMRLSREFQLPLGAWLRDGLLVAVAAMALHAVFRQRLFEEAPAEAPAPRQVEAPPPA